MLAVDDGRFVVGLGRQQSCNRREQQRDGKGMAHSACPLFSLEPEDFHPAILAVSHVNSAFLIQGDSSRQEELARRAPRIAEREKHLAIGIVGLHTVRAAFHHPDPILRVHYYAFWLVKLTCTVTGVSKRRYEIP